MLALKKVTKSYGSVKVLTAASLAVAPKDCVCIVGDGGSGKSTILKLLVRMEDPTSGTVEVDGIPLEKVPPPILQLYRRRLGIAFQEPALLQQATVEENIALPLELFGAPQNITQRTVTDLLQRLLLTSCAKRTAETLSMSERVLTGIARAAVASPMIMLVDEPLQHLDAKQGKAVTDLFSAMHKRGTTLILFSRTEETARAFGARIITLQKGTTSSGSLEQSSAHAHTTHRILEETEGKVHSVLDTKPVQKVGVPKNDKKIRITSIGSGL